MPLAENAASAASPASTLITCTDLNSQKTVVLRANQNLCKPFHAPAVWRIQQSDSTAHTGAGYSNMRICSSKRPLIDYKFIRVACNKYHVVTDYWRATSVPQTPVVTNASAQGHESAIFTLATSETATKLDAPTAYYLITNIKTGQISKITPNLFEQLTLSNLSALTSYTFTIAAVSVDGTSGSSAITPVITTGAIPVVAPTAPALAAPAFTLSAASETRTVNTAATGFTISSTGGAIASFAISSTPPGMSFSTSTGALTGTPTTVASATAYTITAANASGSTTRIFTLTVAAAVVYTVGSTGPGGGTIFYVAATPFACGPTRAATCTFLEAAPALWNGGTEDPKRSFANATYQSTTVGYPAGDTATATAIGWGYRNTLAIISQGNWEISNSAAALAEAHNVTVSGVVFDDWYLPSKDELNQMCKWARGITGVDLTTLTTGCAGGVVNTGSGAAGFFPTYYYRSSSEETATDAWDQNFDAINGNTQTSFLKSYAFHVRPVRAF